MLLANVLTFPNILGIFLRKIGDVGLACFFDDVLFAKVPKVLTVFEPVCFLLFIFLQEWCVRKSASEKARNKCTRFVAGMSSNKPCVQRLCVCGLAHCWFVHGFELGSTFGGIGRGVLFAPLMTHTCGFGIDKPCSP